MTNILWLICAAINVAIAILHIIIIFVGARAYSYFGAGDWMTNLAVQGSPIPALITAGVTAVFFVFAAYNLAGADLLWLPLIKPGLLGITAIYLLRGLVVLAVPFMNTPVTTFDLVSSFIALAIGLLHALAFYQTYLHPRLA